MSVAGLDVGNATSCIAVARKRGIDVLLNKESNRETPSIISFTPKGRLIGTDAVGSLTVNPRNTITQIKRLVGKKFKDPMVQADLQRLPYEVVEGPDGGCLVVVQYLGQRSEFTPEQLLAMLIVDLKAIAASDNSAVTDCVISVPAFFVEKERYAYLNAAQIAGVNCLRLMNETTATALAYGIYKTDLPEKVAINVAFIDFGHSALQVSIVAYKKGQLHVLTHTWDRNLGGRDFDEVLFNHFADEFKEKYKIDVRSNARASFRLRLACEKMKKVLSANAEATIAVECIMNDIDAHSKLTRDQFEEMAAPLLARAKEPCVQALADSGLMPEDISSVEVVGGSSRVPAFAAILKDVLGKDPSRTLNAKESVSRGCALQCAMLSPIFKVREFEVIDSFPFGIEFSWDKEGETIHSVIFERKGPIPSAKMLTFFRNEPIKLEAQYTQDSPIPPSFDRHIGTWVIGPPPNVPAGGEQKAKIKVKVRLNLHGLVSVEYAQQIEEEEYDEVVKKPAPAAAAAPAEPPKDIPMQDADGAAAAPTPDGDEPMEDAQAKPEAGEKPAEAPMEVEEVVKKKRTRKSSVPCEAHMVGLPEKAVQDMFEKECEMELQDRVQAETNDKKNEVEAYVYSLRDKLSGAYANYVSDSDRATLSGKLEATEDWLYDEGEDEKKSVYAAKLEELRKMGEPVKLRYVEDQTRGPAAAALRATATAFLTQASSQDPKLAHISAEDKAKVAEEANKALQWLQTKQDLQASLAKHEDGVLLTNDIKKKEDSLIRFAQPIVTKAPPPPPKPEPAAEAPTAEGEQGEAAAEGQAKPPEVEDMDTEAPIGPEPMKTEL